MISLLRGRVVELEGSTATLDVGGVGYQVFCTGSCRARLEEGIEAQVTIYTEVKEDAIRLYGFADRLEKQVFILLTLVKGVGAKTALDIISKVERLSLLRMIGAGDLTKLQAIKGIGKKTAERILVELKDKVGQFAVDQQGSSLKVETETYEPKRDAISALQALGFSRKDAERAVEQVDLSGFPDNVEPGEVVREALRFV